MQDEITFPDVGALSNRELKDPIASPTNQEREVSYQRRMLHGKIDILRAELVTRLRGAHEAGEPLIKGDDVDQLTRILAGDDPIQGEADGPPLS